MNEVMVAVSGEFIEDKAGAEPIGRLGKDTFHLARRADPLRGLVLAVWSHAGGSGKSTLTRDLAYEMARRGYKVLVIDADPQANLTSWLGYNPVEIQKEQTLLRLVQEESLPDPLPVTFGLEAPLFDLVPANTYLALAEIHIPSKPSGMFLLRGHLRAHRERYDLILIDSPPYLGALAGLAALAGDGLIVPVETSVKGTQALSVAVDVSLEYKRTLVNLGWACLVNCLVPRRGREKGEKNPKAVGDELQKRPRHGRPRLPLPKVPPTQPRLHPPKHPLHHPAKPVHLGVPPLPRPHPRFLPGLAPAPKPDHRPHPRLPQNPPHLLPVKPRVRQKPPPGRRKPPQHLPPKPGVRGVALPHHSTPGP